MKTNEPEFETRESQVKRLRFLRDKLRLFAKKYISNTFSLELDLELVNKKDRTPFLFVNGWIEIHATTLVVKDVVVPFVHAQTIWFSNIATTANMSTIVATVIRTIVNRAVDNGIQAYEVDETRKAING